MPDSRGPRIFLADLLPEHFDELVFLIGERQQALRSPDYTRADLRHVEGRAAAHLDGLLIGGERARLLVGDAMGEEDTAKVQAAASVLLQSRDPAAARAVLAALEGAEKEPQAAGLRAALCKGPVDLVLDSLRAWFDSGPPKLAVAAAEVLAFHGKLDRRAQRLTKLLGDGDPLVCRAAWRVAAIANNG